MYTRRKLLRQCSAAVAGVALPAPSAEMELVRLDGSRIRPGEVDRHVTSLMRAAKIPGLCVAVFNRGKTIYIHAFGLRDVQESKAMTVDTVMYGASFTKSAFAYMFMQLVEENVFDLDKPVSRYLPKPLPEYDKYRDLAADPRYMKITSRIILDHTTGFPNYRALNNDGKLDIKFDPGTQYSYSGEGMNLLGFVVEQVTGKPVTELMKVRVFDRFHMNRTSMTWQPEFESNYAIGYDERQRPLGHQKRKSARAAGSMDTTISDFAKFIEGVFARRGLSRTSWDTMLSPQVRIYSKHQFPTPSKETTHQNDGIQLSYGLGWGLFQSPYGRAYFKEGHDDGWENHFVCFDHNQTGVVLMSNSSNGDSIFKDLLAFLIGDTFTPWEWEGYIPYNRRPVG